MQSINEGMIEPLSERCTYCDSDCAPDAKVCPSCGQDWPRRPDRRGRFKRNFKEFSWLFIVALIALGPGSVILYAVFFQPDWFTNLYN